MPTHSGPNIVDNGLVLSLDAADNNSFRGEPTTNLFLNPTFIGTPGTQTSSVSDNWYFSGYSGDTGFKFYDKSNSPIPLQFKNEGSLITTDSNNTPVVAGDIVGVAFDATNGKLWFHKNGTYIDDLSGYVGNPTTAAYPYHTGMQTGILYTVMSDVWQNASGSLLIKSYNFGNGYFGTTAVSSAGSNASGNGIFEYDVPTGYTALSTKGLNT